MEEWADVDGVFFGVLVVVGASFEVVCFAEVLGFPVGLGWPLFVRVWLGRVPPVWLEGTGGLDLEGAGVFFLVVFVFTGEGVFLGPESSVEVEWVAIGCGVGLFLMEVEEERVWNPDLSAAAPATKAMMKC